MPRVNSRKSVILLISLTLVFSLSLLLPKSSARTIQVPADYPTLQAAIDAANPGDLINVAPGTYFERLEITKSLHLVSENPEKTSIISSETVIRVNANNVEIRGFTVKGGTYGIFLWHSSGAVLRSNVMSGNKWNFGVWGNSVSHFVHDVDSSNTVDGKPIFFWVNQNQKTVPKDAGYVALVNCTQIKVENMRLTSNEQGVLLVNTSGSLVRNVSMRGNDEGIVLRWSSNNTIALNSLFAINWHAVYLLSSEDNTFYGNTIQNGTYGVSSVQSNGTIFYQNNLMSNKEQIYQEGSFSKWDNGSVGNYWSDYKGEDLNNDGIGDTLLPHFGVDYYPLIRVFDKQPPIAEAGANQKVSANSLVFFNGSNSYDNVGIVGYTWDFGDGSNGSGVTVEHAYAAVGFYKVTLEVTDVAGNTSEDVTEITVVEPTSPWTWYLLFAGVGAVALMLVLVFLMRKSRSRKGATNKKMMSHRFVQYI